MFGGRMNWEARMGKSVMYGEDQGSQMAKNAIANLRQIPIVMQGGQVRQVYMFNLIGNFGLNLTPLPTQSVSQQGAYNCTYIELWAATKSAPIQRHCFNVFIFCTVRQLQQVTWIIGSCVLSLCNWACHLRSTEYLVQYNPIGTIATLFSPKQTYMRNAKLHGWAGASCYLEMPGQEAMS